MGVKAAKFAHSHAERHIYICIHTYIYSTYRVVWHWFYARRMDAHYDFYDQVSRWGVCHSLIEARTYAWRLNVARWPCRNIGHANFVIWAVYLASSFAHSVYYIKFIRLLHKMAMQIDCSFRAIYIYINIYIYYILRYVHNCIWVECVLMAIVNP